MVASVRSQSGPIVGRSFARICLIMSATIAGMS
jgi:hypothetical protein